jgi:hypothetical protein
MLHPRLTSLDGQQAWLAQIGPYGAWSDLAYSFRYGSGACGMFEASWSMPLAADFEHPILRRGTLVELMDGSYRVGSPLVLTEPARGDGVWTFTATGIGREVEGDNSWGAYELSGVPSATPTVAIATAISYGLPWAGYDVATTPSTALTATPEFQSLGSLLSQSAMVANKRWGVGQDNIHRFIDDPTTPTYHVVPGVAALGVADDDYASVVILQYSNSGAGGASAIVFSAGSEVYGRREYLVNLTGDDGPGPIPTATAQAYADGILAKSKGRLGWTNGLTLNSNEILTAGGVPADLSKVAEDVGNGCMVRLHGIFNDLLEYNGQTWLDILIGEAKLVDGAQTIDLSPMGLVARDLASVVEAVTGFSSAA